MPGLLAEHVRNNSCSELRCVRAWCCRPEACACLVQHTVASGICTQRPVDAEHGRAVGVPCDACMGSASHGALLRPVWGDDLLRPHVTQRIREQRAAAAAEAAAAGCWFMCIMVHARQAKFVIMSMLNMSMLYMALVCMALCIQAGDKSLKLP